MRTDMDKISLKILLGVTALALGIIYYVTAFFLPELQGNTMLLMAFLIDLSLYSVVLLTISHQLKKGDVPFSAILGKSNLNVKKVIPAVSLIILHFCVIVSGLFFVVRLMLLTQVGTALSLELLMEPTVSSQLSFLPLTLKFIIAVIVAPIVEEVLFRGVFLNKLAVRFGIKKGILFSSIIFMVFHINSLFIPQLIAGLLFGIIYIKTKQLIYPILAHSLNNLIPFLLNFIPEGDTSELHLDISELISALNVLSVVFIIVMFVFIIVTVKYAKQISSEVIPFRFNTRFFG